MSAPLETAGIYVHVPFCLTRCGYCDFNAYAGLDHLASRYVSALLREAELAAPAWEDVAVVSVFLGGGTPTTLPVADLKALLARVRSAFSVADDAEVTDRGEPGHGRRHDARRIRDAGFGRLSMGAQSFDPSRCWRPWSASTSPSRSRGRSGPRGRPATRT